MKQKEQEILENNWKSLLPNSMLERHYGISHSSIHSVQLEDVVDIGRLPGLLITWRIEVNQGLDKLVHTWFSSRMSKSLDDASIGLSDELLWENQDDINTLFKFVEFSGDQGRVAFVHGTSMPLGNVTRIRKGKEETTNQHFVFHTSKNEIRAKIYSDPQKGQKEVRMASKLAAANIHPLVLGSLDFIGQDGQPTGTIALFSAEIATLQNIDLLTGEIYSKFIQGGVSENECLIALQRYAQQAAMAFAQLHAMLNRQRIPQNEVEHSFREIGKAFTLKLKEKEMQKLGINANSDKIILWHLERLLQRSGAARVHFDVWWRQFAIDEKNQIYILDLEDSQIAFLGYDVGSWINSILQQGEYFAKDLVDGLKVKVRNIASELSAYLWQELKFLNPYTNMTSIEVDLGRFLRSVHELDYLLRHQPAEAWLLGFIKKNNEEIFSRLKEKVPGS